MTDIAAPPSNRHWILVWKDEWWDLHRRADGESRTFYSHDESTGEPRQFLKSFRDIQVGDQVLGYVAGSGLVAELVVVSKSSRAKGRVTAEAGVDVEFRKVRSLPRAVTLDELHRYSRTANISGVRQNLTGSLFTLTPIEWNAIHALIEGTATPDQDRPRRRSSRELPKPVLQANTEGRGAAALPADVFLATADWDRARHALLEKRSVVLQGPPGVGKTFVARRLAESLVGDKDGQITTVQFHQSYSYEDFVEGFRPEVSADGQLRFVLQHGIFRRVCEQAKQQGIPRVVILDEINRGNLSKILGEVLSLLECDKRSEAHRVALAYSKEPFYVPKNVYVIGTMNTADRSLALVDYALRRRFRFQSLEPAFDQPAFREYLQTCGASEAIIATIIDRVTALNTAIREDPALGPAYLIGHSFFCPASSIQDAGDSRTPLDEAWYRRVIAGEVQPLLEEYWIDKPGKSAARVKALTEGVGG